MDIEIKVKELYISTDERLKLAKTSNYWSAQQKTKNIKSIKGMLGYIRKGSKGPKRTCQGDGRNEN